MKAFRPPEARAGLQSAVIRHGRFLSPAQLRAARPKRAVPTRTMVAPSSMATSKSWLIPIDRCGNIDGSPLASRSESRSSRRRREIGSCLLRIFGQRWEQHEPTHPGRAAGSGGVDDLADRVQGRAVLRDLSCQVHLDQQVGGCPLVARSPHPACAADRGCRRCESRRTERRPCAPCFDCKWPTKCHVICSSVDTAIFCRASCTRFSPNSVWPAATAARTCSMPDVFEMATSRMSSGFRPAVRAARVMRDRTADRLAAIVAASPGLGGASGWPVATCGGCVAMTTAQSA